VKCDLNSASVSRHLETLKQLQGWKVFLDVVGQECKYENAIKFMYMDISPTD